MRSCSRTCAYYLVFRARRTRIQPLSITYPRTTPQAELLRCLILLVTGPNRLFHRWLQDSCYFISFDQCQVLPRALLGTCKSQIDKIQLLFDLECSLEGLMHPSCTESLRSLDRRLEYSLDQGSSCNLPLSSESWANIRSWSGCAVGVLRLTLQGSGKRRHGINLLRS